MNRDHYYIARIIKRRNNREPIKPMVHPVDDWLDRCGHYLYWFVMGIAFGVICLIMAGVIE